MGKLSVDDERAIIELYAIVDNARDCSKRFGVSDQTIYRVLQKHGIKRTGNRAKRQNSKFVSNCRTAHCRTVTVCLFLCKIERANIAKQLGLSNAQVCNDIKRIFGKQRRINNLTQKQRQEIARMYKDGISTYEIGRVYSVHHSRVSDIAKEYGIPLRGKGGGCVKEANRKRREQATERWKDSLDHLDYKRRYEVRRNIRITSQRYDSGITWKALAKRDGLSCYICGKTCNPNDRRYGTNGDDYPSVDHVVALADGGTHTWDNVKLACCYCNSHKQAIVSKAG